MPPSPAAACPACCAGVLGEHLPDLLADPDCLREVLPALPSEAKACLLAVARLRSLLCDAALAALADEGHTLLDLRGCGAALSEGGIRAALRAMPHLRFADLGSCHVGGATLRTLGESCPALEVLRLGSPVTDASTTAARCLLASRGAAAELACRAACKHPGCLRVHLFSLCQAAGGVQCSDECTTYCCPPACPLQGPCRHPPRAAGAAAGPRRRQLGCPAGCG